MNNNLRTDLIVEILPKNKTNKVDDIEITRVHLNSKDEAKKIYEFVNGKFDLVFIEEKEVEKEV